MMDTRSHLPILDEGGKEEGLEYVIKKKPRTDLCEHHCGIRGASAKTAAAAACASTGGRGATFLLSLPPQSLAAATAERNHAQTYVSTSGREASAKTAAAGASASTSE